MQKMNSNIIMIFLLVAVGVYFILGAMLNIGRSETLFIIGFILLFFGIVLIHGYKTLGLRELFVFFLIAYCIPLLYEYTDAVGFGTMVGCRSSYSALLGSRFLGKVPYVIPLVWSLLLYCSFTMTNIMFHRIRTTDESDERCSLRWFVKIIGIGIVAGFILASLDLIIDPVMVAMGAWSWSYEGLYYGIPVLNYVGWMEITFSTFLFYSMYLLFHKKSQVYIGGERQSRYTVFVVALYVTALIIYAIYAVDHQVTYVIPWAVVTVGPFAVIVVIQFYRFATKDGKEVSFVE
jgi:uncharacterized membrane protein